MKNCIIPGLFFVANSITWLGRIRAIAMNKIKSGINLMNSANTVGRVGQDPELRYFESGRVLAKFSIYILPLKIFGNFFNFLRLELGQ
ncbi:single-stranded DNA-binding protein [Laspinema olomoucense]|uniref:single-stranded DNA-binding protein n=1 Tax=Laspinema olomoucense TaxID=3231600 RepID=UPI0021BA6A3B|nr:single-stranded DNA-binding protein [Laspinema sp. D3c]MCT7996227.1 single-stranded DNA-binding protein [Laspinema sp. D3c]